MLIRYWLTFAVAAPLRVVQLQVPQQRGDDGDERGQEQDGGERAQTVRGPGALQGDERLQLLGHGGGPVVNVETRSTCPDSPGPYGIGQAWSCRSGGKNGLGAIQISSGDSTAVSAARRDNAVISKK
jgi:hypothetical protein